MLFKFINPHGASLVFRRLRNRIINRIGKPVGAAFPEMESHPDHTWRACLVTRALTTTPHHGGIPFLTIASQLTFKRTTLLLIVSGPPGMKERLAEAMEVMFPGSSRVERKFSIEIMEFSVRAPVIAEGVTVTPYINSHSPLDSSFALRIECGGMIIGYSSDTEWTESLYETAKDSDLFIVEAYYYEKKIKGHMDYLTLISHYIQTGAKRLVLTHMSRDMLSMLDKVDCEYAEDGKVIHI